MRTRLFHTEEDYKKLGLKHNVTELWEDGRRNTGKPGTWELWYFDAIMDDGTKLGMIFYDKHVGNIERDVTPCCSINITLPDGSLCTDQFEYSAEEGKYGSDHCNVVIGPHSFVGDLKNYEIEIKPIHGIGAKIKMENLSSPWRAETSHIGFGEHDENFMAWFCVVPRGKVEGEIMVNGKTIPVSGFGYHDHQWGNLHVMLTNNHWIWIRQSVNDHVVLVYDFVAAKNYGYDRYPLFFIQDGKGNVLFQNTSSENVKMEILEEYEQKETGKTCPKKFRYTFEKDGKKAVYTITNLREIEVIDNYKTLDSQSKKFFDGLGLKPSYVRWEAIGELEFNDGNTWMVNGKSNLIYEMMYNATEYRKFVE